MNIHLLDAGGAGLVFAFLILFMIAAIAIEGIIMLLMKYNRAGKVFLDSFIVNVGSLATGYILSSFSGDLFRLTNSVWVNWFILYAVTVVIEFLLLCLLNRKHTAGKTLLTSIVINIASYIILYFFVGR